MKVDFVSPVSMANKIDQNFKLKIPPKCPPEVYNGECHMNLLRKMQASFGWDWGLAAPSMGIWKPAFLEIYDTANIRDVTYQLIDDMHQWTLNITVYVETGVKESMIDGVLTYELQ